MFLTRESIFYIPTSFDHLVAFIINILISADVHDSDTLLILVIMTLIIMVTALMSLELSEATCTGSQRERISSQSRSWAIMEAEPGGGLGQVSSG